MDGMKHIRVEREGAVGILTIARRERLNSLDVETAQDFRRAGLQLARDREVRAVLIRGEGGVFCSGADLKYIRDGGDRDDLGYLQPETREPDEGYGEIFKQILEVHPQHHLRDPPSTQAIHRGRGRDCGGGRLRHCDDL